MVNVPNPVGLSTGTSVALGRIWVILFIIGISVAIIGFLIQSLRSRQ